jgi:hypothetical protein
MDSDMSRTVRVGVGLTVLVGGAVLWLLSRPCCTTGVEARQYQVSRELSRVRAAQQVFYRRHERYATTLDELSFQQQDSNVVLQFETQGSSVLVSGSSIHGPKVTCLMQATPGMKITRSFMCTPRK